MCSGPSSNLCLPVGSELALNGIIYTNEHLHLDTNS